MPPKRKPPAKSPYSIAERLDPGTVIPDFKKNWIIGGSIGQGGFGCIYLVRLENEKDFSYAAKIEPCSNGPLFTEIHFYQRICIEKLIKSWKTAHSLKFLGIPRYISHGTFSPSNQVPCRFLIMDRFLGDFDQVLRNHQITPVGVLIVSIHVLNALEYMHSNGYAHADIKATNLLHQKSKEEVYLVDFGLVNRFQINDRHCESKPDPKYKDNGTVEFCSRDSHMGLQPARRGDLEILIFNIIHWLARSHPDSPQTHSTGLPWGSLIGDPERRKQITPSTMLQICQEKVKAMTHPAEFVLQTGFGRVEPLIKFIQLVNQMSYTDCPDYDQLRKLLSNARTSLSSSGSTPSNQKSAAKPRGRPSKRQSSSTPTVAPSPIVPNSTPTRKPIKSPTKAKPSPRLAESKTPFTPSPPKVMRLPPASKKNTPALASPAIASPLVPRSNFRTPTQPSTSSRKTPLPNSGAGDHSLSNLFSSDDDFHSPASRKPTPRSARNTPQSNRSRKPKVNLAQTAIANPNDPSLSIVHPKASSAKLVSRRSGFCQTSPELLRIARAEYLSRRQRMN